MKYKSQSPIDSLVKGLKTLLASLPSEEEKAELLQTLHEAKDFLEEVQRLIEAFPTAESSQSLSQGLSRLDILADRATNDSPLRRLMGLKGPQRHSAKSVNGKDDVKSRAKKLGETIRRSESPKIAGLIEQSGEPLSVLTELATSLGLRTPSKVRKADLTKLIAIHITNRRGYKLLRDGGRVVTDDEFVPSATSM